MWPVGWCACEVDTVLGQGWWFMDMRFLVDICCCRRFAVTVAPSTVYNPPSPLYVAAAGAALSENGFR